MQFRVKVLYIMCQTIVYYYPNVYYYVVSFRLRHILTYFADVFVQFGFRVKLCRKLYHAA